MNSSPSSSSSSSSPSGEERRRSVISNDDIRKSLSDDIEARASKEMQEITDRMQRNKNAITEFVSTHRDIPIIRGDEESVTVECERVYVRKETYTLLDGGVDSFFMSRLSNIGDEGSEEDEDAEENEEDAEEEREEMVLEEFTPSDYGMTSVRTFPYDNDFPYYMGKQVRLAAPGEKYHEDETAIYVERLDGVDENFHLYYLSNMHRNRNGIMTFNGLAYDEQLYNERMFIDHFGGVPWYVKFRHIDDVADVIFRNLHTDEVRRYIIEVDKRCIFLMLGGEFYFIRREYGLVPVNFVVSCRTGKKVMKRGNDRENARPLALEGCEEIVSCRNYVVISNQECTLITILRLVNEE